MSWVIEEGWRRLETLCHSLCEKIELVPVILDLERYVFTVADTASVTLCNSRKDCTLRSLALLFFCSWE